MSEQDEKQGLTRREFIRTGARGAALVGLGAATGGLIARSRSGDTVWQIDPDKCIACGNCATYCVLNPSAVKCVHAFDVCYYCEKCFGYYDLEAADLETGAENQLCPTGAIRRRTVRPPQYEYSIDEQLCIGCGKCVKGCTIYGKGALFLQVRHDRCLNCNECAIAAACPADAFRRVPADKPYLLKSKRKERGDQT